MLIASKVHTRLTSQYIGFMARDKDKEGGGSLARGHFILLHYHYTENYLIKKALAF